MNNILNMLFSGALNQNPMMKEFNRLMAGKNTQQQMQTLINIAQNKGIDINEKRFSKDELRKLGFKF